MFRILSHAFLLQSALSTEEFVLDPQIASFTSEVPFDSCGEALSDVGEALSGSNVDKMKQEAEMLSVLWYLSVEPDLGQSVADTVLLPFCG